MEPSSFHSSLRQLRPEDASKVERVVLSPAETEELLARLRSRATVVRESVSVSVPRQQWPAWATAVAAMRGEGDTGVGDTAARLSAASGIKSMVEWVKAKTGLACNCAARQERWNAKYPYDPENKKGPAML